MELTDCAGLGHIVVSATTNRVFYLTSGEVRTLDVLSLKEETAAWKPSCELSLPDEKTFLTTAYFSERLPIMPMAIKLAQHALQRLIPECGIRNPSRLKRQWIPA